jgi:hypothetical protein
MAGELTEAAISGARGAFAFAAGEWSDDELRLGAKALDDLEATPAWQVLTRLIETRREVAVQAVIHSSPRSTTQAEYAAVDWVRFAPEVLRRFAQERDEANKRELEAARGRAGEE